MFERPQTGERAILVHVGLQGPPDPQELQEFTALVRSAAADAGRDPDDITICVAAPAYVGDDIAYMRDQCRWFGGMVGNHVADIVAKYGREVVSLQLPIGEEAAFSGVVDLITMKALYFEGAAGEEVRASVDRFMAELARRHRGGG